jgi:hypothetical protein
MNQPSSPNSLSLGRRRIALLAALAALGGCAHGRTYHDQAMDFTTIKTVAVFPLANLSRENVAADRVRDVLTSTLLATGAFYVVPTGEVARGIVRVNVAIATAPTPEEVVKVAKLISADAVIVGAVKEYGEVRAASSVANSISMSLELFEAQTGRVVWSGTTTKGGVGATERLFGGGGAPMNHVTEEAVDALLDQLFR